MNRNRSAILSFLAVLFISSLLLTSCQSDSYAAPENAVLPSETDTTTSQPAEVSPPVSDPEPKIPMNVLWGRQIGTPLEDLAVSIAVDGSGNSIIAGFTKGDVSGVNKGYRDLLIAKFDTDGNRLWLSQNGTEKDDAPNFITLDRDGNALVTGTTYGAFSADAIGMMFVQKLDKDGAEVWTKQYGDGKTSTSFCIKADENNTLFMAGTTNGVLGEKSYGSSDAFLSKLSAEGDVLWTCQWGTDSSDEAKSIAFDSVGNIVVGGSTTGDFGEGKLGSADVFITLISPEGNVILSKQYGSSEEETASQVLVDGNHDIYIAGSTMGSIEGKQIGSGDAFVIKTSSSGDVLWKKQFGTNLWDGVHGIVLSKADPTHVIVGGCQHWNACEAFIRKYDSDGNLIWIHELSPSFSTCGREIGIDDNGNLYQTGGTHGKLYNDVPFKGPESDIFIVKTNEE